MNKNKPLDRIKLNKKFIVFGVKWNKFDIQNDDVHDKDYYY